MFCPACGEPRGISKHPKSAVVFCNEYCAVDYRLSSQEDRDSLIEFLAKERFLPDATIAQGLGTGLSRQVVTAVLRRRLSAP
jgi:hypothetical protein